MSNPFFEHPILNSPYERPQKHWELDESGQPTQKIIENRRRAEFITPIPKPKKRKRVASQQEIVFDEGKGLSTKQQQYDATSIINQVRNHVDALEVLNRTCLVEPSGLYGSSSALIGRSPTNALVMPAVMRLQAMSANS